MNATTADAIARAVAALEGADDGASPNALLIDLDNIGMPAVGYARTHLDAVIEAAGPVAVTVASGRDVAFEAFRDACEEVDVVVFESPAVRNGADIELLAVASALAEAGVRDFVIASGDHGFTKLPGTVRVVVPIGRQLSERLAAAVDEVTWVDVPRPPRSRASASRARRRAAAKRRMGTGCS